MSSVLKTVDFPLLGELRTLIEQARQHVARMVNSTTSFHWQVGVRLQRQVLNNDRAEYGQQILATLSQELVRDYLDHIPDMKLMQVQLHRALSTARERAAKRQLPHATQSPATDGEEQ